MTNDPGLIMRRTRPIQVVVEAAEEPTAGKLETDSRDQTSDRQIYYLPVWTQDSKTRIEPNSMCKLPRDWDWDWDFLGMC
jgi:hypothetical protein